MCDYSLAGLPNRLAVEGEQLVVHGFGDRGDGVSSLISRLEALPLSFQDAGCVYSPRGRSYGYSIFLSTCNNAWVLARSRRSRLSSRAQKHTRIATPYGLRMGKRFHCNGSNTASVWKCSASRPKTPPRRKEIIRSGSKIIDECSAAKSRHPRWLVNFR